MADSNIDFTALAQATDDLRELARTVVAGLRSDGFTDREAHQIATHVLAPPQETQVESKPVVSCFGCGEGPFTYDQALAHEHLEQHVGHEYSLHRE